MRELDYDALIIGGGAAGMAAALPLCEAGYRVAIIDREGHLGGILMQCIHNGFGLRRYKEELTGPEFAERFAGEMLTAGVDLFLDTTVMEIEANGPDKTVLACGQDQGLLRLTSRVLVLAMGCRERNRGNLAIPGGRPAGIYTAGLAQRLLNIEGCIPGERAVIVGSGDIGLIMARRLKWVGSDVPAVVEILPHPSGVTRNIVQCLHDFDIPLYLSHVVSRIEGRDRVEAVEVTPLDGGTPQPDRAFRIECDTVLLSVGLLPETELSEKAGIRIGRDTGGPTVDAGLMTSEEGVFACGNVLHVHDLVDWAAEEGERCGHNAVTYLRGERAAGPQGSVLPGANVKYVVPHHYRPDAPNRFSLRSLVMKDRAELVVRREGAVLKRRKLRHVKPAEMIHFDMKADELAARDSDAGPKAIEVAVE